MNSAVGSEDSAGADPEPGGVGGRQARLGLRMPGGGYLDICTKKNAAVDAPRAAADPRISELRKVGLPRIWITVAQEIGFEAFMRVWEVMMRNGHVDERCRIVVPNMARYMRFQRNQLVRQLVEEGLDIEQIVAEVQRATGEVLTEYQIRRVAVRA